MLYYSLLYVSFLILSDSASLYVCNKSMEKLSNLTSSWPNVYENCLEFITIKQPVSDLKRICYYQIRILSLFPSQHRQHTRDQDDRYFFFSPGCPPLVDCVYGMNAKLNDAYIHSGQGLIQSLLPSKVTSLMRSCQLDCPEGHTGRI